MPQKGNDQDDVGGLDGQTTLQIGIIAFLAIGIAVELIIKAGQTAGWAEGQAAIQQAGSLPLVGTVAKHVELTGIGPNHDPYRLLSFDNGKTWWSLSRDRDQITKAPPELARHAVQSHDIGRPALGSD